MNKKKKNQNPEEKSYYWQLLKKKGLLKKYGLDYPGAYKDWERKRKTTYNEYL